MSAYLELSNLTKTYPTPQGPAVIVRNFNLTIQKGEFVCLIGHSGCGKSTVLSMVAGLTESTEGGIILAGRELAGPGPDRGIVFQSPCLLPWLTALDNVLLGVNQVFWTASTQERRQIAEYYLAVVGLADAAHQRPAELSQGMRQRVGIARAFALAPKMLLLDEPFGMLDSLTRAELQQVLIELWRKDKKTALMVTHDVDEALFLADRIVMMTNGPAAEVGEIMEVRFPRPRERRGVREHPDYYRLREQLIEFLEVRAYRGQPPHREPTPPATPPAIETSDMGPARHARAESLREGCGSLPLTPTLSPEEREPGIQSVREGSARGQEYDSFTLAATPNAILPLPGGEGRGEGKAGLNGHRGSSPFPEYSTQCLGLSAVASHGEDNDSLPLTPALSPEERELGIQSVREVGARGQEQNSFTLAATPNGILPLPGGEGRGEGKGVLNGQVDIIQLPNHSTQRLGLRAVANHGVNGGSLPLTPTLSPGEREPGIQSVRDK